MAAQSSYLFLVVLPACGADAWWPGGHGPGWCVRGPGSGKGSGPRRARRPWWWDSPSGWGRGRRPWPWRPGRSRWPPPRLRPGRRRGSRGRCCTATPRGSCAISLSSRSMTTCSSRASSTGPMLSGKSTLDRARLAVPAMTIRSSRLLVARASRPRASACAAARRRGRAAGHDGAAAPAAAGSAACRTGAPRNRVRRSARASSARSCPTSMTRCSTLPVSAISTTSTLRGASRHEFDVPHHGPAEVRVLHDGDLVGQLRQQPHGPLQDVVEVVGAFQQRLDGAAFRRRERLDRRDLVHEEPVALVRGDPAGAGVRGRDQALVLQRGHVVADGGTGDARGGAVPRGPWSRQARGNGRSPPRWPAALRVCVVRSRSTSIAVPPVPPSAGRAACRAGTRHAVSTRHA